MKRIIVFMLSIIALLCSFCACLPPRTSHTVLFFVDGWQYAAVVWEEGTEMDPPLDPGKEGFSFEGWFTDEKTLECLFTPTKFSRFTEKYITVYAKWKETSDHSDPEA